MSDELLEEINELKKKVALNTVLVNRLSKSSTDTIASLAKEIIGIKQEVVKLKEDNTKLKSIVAQLSLKDERFKDIKLRNKVEDLKNLEVLFNELTKTLPTGLDALKDKINELN